MTELISEVDRDDNFLGLRPREDFYLGNHIHRASQLILLDPENRMLLQKRAPGKYWYPNVITSYSIHYTKLYDDAFGSRNLRRICQAQQEA